MNLRKKEPMLETDWPYDQRYDCKCKGCKTNFAGPKEAYFCWECCSEAQKSQWRMQNGEFSSDILMAGTISASEIVAWEATNELRFVQRVVGGSIRHILQQKWIGKTHVTTKTEWRDVPTEGKV